MSFWAKIAASWRRPVPEHSPARTLDTTPADGLVEVVPIPGLTSRANPLDGRFREFVALESGPDVSRAEGRHGSKPPSLLGRVVFVSLFVGCDGKAWKDQEIVKTLAALIRAGEWIEDQARQWHAAVNFGVAEVYFGAIDPVAERASPLAVISEEYGEGLMDADAEVRAVASASRVAALLGFHDAGDMASRVAGRLVADRIVWFVHLRSAGRSFALAGRDGGIPGLDLAVCFAREADLSGPLAGKPYADPATFIHEALHLFGASDKYGVELDRFAAGSVTGRDIMRLDVERLARLQVDPATAREIGWGPAPGNEKRGR